MPPPSTYGSGFLSLLRRRLLAHESQESSRIHDANWRPLSHREQIAVPSHEHIRVPRDRAREDPTVIWIPHGDFRGCPELGNDFAFAEELLDRRDCLRRELGLLPQRSAQLAEYDLADLQIGLRKDVPRQVSADLARADGAHPRSCPGRPSRDVPGNVLVGQVAPGFGEGQHLPAKLLEANQAELPLERFTDDLAPRATRMLHEAVQELAQAGIEADGDGGAHV